MDRIYVILVFIITFIIYQHLLWYVPHDFQYKSINEEITIIDDIDNIQNCLNHTGPLVLDARQLFEYNWDNFEIPIQWIKEHLVCGSIELKDEELQYETNVSYSKKNENTEYFQCFIKIKVKNYMQQFIDILNFQNALQRFFQSIKMILL